MPVWRMQVSIGADSGFVRDRFVITPHFNDSGVGTDPDSLAADLAAGIATWAGGPREVRVQAYDAQGTPPVFPQADEIVNPTAYPPSTPIREIACCLSFYAGRNLPRQRGRLYLPLVLLTGGGGLRPSGAQMTKAAALVPLFTGLGGADVDWCVYSRVDDTPRSVTNWWVDDEWDVIRSRGLRATTRQEGTTGEA